MRSLFSVLGVFLLCTISLAQEVETLIVAPATGTYILEVKGNGEVSIRPIRLVRLGEAPPPIIPGDLTPFEAEISKWTKSVLNTGGNKTTAAALSTVYSLVSSGVSDGSIPKDQAFAAVKKATDSVLNLQTDSAAWATFRFELGKALTTLTADGSLDEKEEVVDILASISKGMNAASGYDSRKHVGARRVGQGVLDGIDLAKLIELIKLIMELIKTFSK